MSQDPIDCGAMAWNVTVLARVAGEVELQWRCVDNATVA